jgi:GNAT superfamily N-acetyltransferase
MLQNERSFDKLFCEVSQSPRFDLYYNQQFAEDPVFNHAVIADSILNESADQSGYSPDSVFEEIGAMAETFRVPPTIFVEEYWKRARFFEKSAIEFGYVIAGSMNIMSKRAKEDNISARQDFEFVKTRDIALWNKTFMHAFSIGPRWEKELTKRLELLSSTDASLCLSFDKDGNAVGCVLLHVDPQRLMGVYCVGTVPEKRDMGVATLMLGKTEQRALELGCDELTLQTIVSDGTTPFYLNLGYRVEFTRNVLQLPESRLAH